MQYTEQDVQDNMGLVFLIADKMQHLTTTGIMEYRDLVSEGVLGLIHALERFDPETGNKFSSYAYKCVWGFMLRGHRNLHQERWRAKNSKFEVPNFTFSIYQPTPNSDEVREVVGMDDRGLGGKQILTNAHNKKVWERLLPELTPRQRQVVELIIQGVPQTEIADRLGVTRQCVGQTKFNAIKRAKQVFFDEEKEAACL